MNEIPRGTAEANARWVAAQAGHAPCVVCGRPVRKSRKKEILSRYIERKVCTDKACRKENHRQASMNRTGYVMGTPVYRRGELVAVDYAGGFGRQTVRVQPMPGRLPEHVEERSYTSVASAWLL